MITLTVSEKDYKGNNLLYAQTNLSKLSEYTGFDLNFKVMGSRSFLTITCPKNYAEIVSLELKDKLAEIVAINYKYDFFKKNIKVNGLNANEYEILIASLIAADFEDDKRYVYDKLKDLNEFAIDGVFNFRLQSLKRKWIDIVSYIPTCFINSQLKDFIRFLLENRKTKVYIENGCVFDSHFRKLERVNLLGYDNLQIIREVILSNAGYVVINGKIPKEDEEYLKEFFGDKIEITDKYYH